MKLKPKSLLWICMVILPIQIFSQVKSIHSLPKQKRDKVLIEMATKAVKTYGPAYYRDSIPPTIQDLGLWDEKHNYYRVYFHYDPQKESLIESFAAYVLINADNNKIARVVFGNNKLLMAPFPDTIIPYETKEEVEKRLACPSPPYSAYLDFHSYSDDKVRDSVFICWCNQYIKLFAPEYYKKIETQKIDTGRYQNGWFKGEKFFRLNCYGRMEEKRQETEFLMSITVGTRCQLHYVNLSNGIQISNQGYYYINKLERPTNRGLFFIPYIAHDIKLQQDIPIQLTTLPNKTRDSILLQKGKEAILSIGPTYYREFQRPLIDSTSRINVGQGEYRRYYQSTSPPLVKLDTCDMQENLGREFYRIRFRPGYDDTFWEVTFCAEVYIWADTAQSFCIRFGNAVIVIFDGLDHGKIPELVPFQDKKHPL